MIIETNYFGNFEQTDNPEVILIPIPYEYTTSFIKGTKNGPQTILNASTQLEKFDDELLVDISKIGINTTGFVNCEFVSNKSKHPFNEVEQAVRDVIIGGSVPVILGGESSITYGAIKAINDLFPEISILHFGSRCNLKSSHMENDFSHQCTFKRTSEMVPELKVIHAGIRSISEEEAEWLEENTPNTELFFAKDKNRWNVVDILSNLTKNVYISFEFNALDSSVLPTAAMTEPGGFNWEQITDILKNICTFKEIIGMDFTGFSPLPNSQAHDFLGAKLIYKTIGYSFARELGVFEEEEVSLAGSES